LPFPTSDPSFEGGKTLALPEGGAAPSPSVDARPIAPGYDLFGRTADASRGSGAKTNRSEGEGKREGSKIDA